MLTYFDNLPRGLKRILLMGVDIFFLPMALWVSLSLRLSQWFPSISDIYWVFILAPGIAFPVFLKLGLYRAVIRYMGGKAIMLKKI